jgi:hypothetical protein
MVMEGNCESVSMKLVGVAKTGVRSAKARLWCKTTSFNVQVCYGAVLLGLVRLKESADWVFQRAIQTLVIN